MKSKSLAALPGQVRRALQQLGADIRQARIRRQITIQSLADRTFASPTTIYHIERGNPAVAIGTYATVLFVLGLHEGIAKLAAPNEDSVGTALFMAHLPKRVRKSIKRPF